MGAAVEQSLCSGIHHLEPARMVLYDVVGAACLCVLMWYICKVTLFSPMRQMPGPRGLPVFGSAFSIEWPMFHLQLSEWQSKYGPVMRVPLMGNDIVVISSIKAAKEALVVRDVDFAGRPPRWRIDSVYNFKGLGIENFSPGLVEKRKLMHQHFKAAHSDGFDRLERIVLDEMRDFVEQIASYKAKPVDAKFMTTAFFSNILATMVFGERYQYDDPVVKNILDMGQAMMDNASATSSGKELDVFPWLRFTGLFSKAMKNLAQLESLRDAVLTEKVKERRASFNPSSCVGIIDNLLSRSVQGSDTKSHVVWDDEQIVSYLLDVFAAGTQTSSNSMQAAYLVLLKYPEIQIRIQKEIDSIIGDSEPSVKHRSKMPYTEAFLLELLRYSTVAPLMVPHMTSKDTSVGGYFVPAKTEVVINSWDIHHDDKVYPEPFEFRPERFLDNDGKVHNYDHPSRANFIIFGAGRRSCPGEQFAVARLFLLLTSLLQRFSLTQDETQPAPDPDPRSYRMSLVLDVPECFFVAVPRK